MCSSTSIAPYQTLTTFSLAYNSVSNDGAEHLANALKVNQVDIGYLGCASSCVDSKYVSCWQTLTTLDLSGNKIKDPAARHLLEALQIYRVRHTCGRLSDFDCCDCSQTITTLDLTRNRIGARGTKYISKILRTNEVWEFSDYFQE